MVIIIINGGGYAGDTVRNSSDASVCLGKKRGQKGQVPETIQKVRMGKIWTFLLREKYASWSIDVIWLQAKNTESIVLRN